MVIETCFSSISEASCPRSTLPGTRFSPPRRNVARAAYQAGLMEIGHDGEVHVIRGQGQGVGREFIDHGRPLVGLKGALGFSRGAAGIDQKNRIGFGHGWRVSRGIRSVGEFIRGNPRGIHIADTDREAGRWASGGQFAKVGGMRLIRHQGRGLGVIEYP